MKDMATDCCSDCWVYLKFLEAYGTNLSLTLQLRRNDGYWHKTIKMWYIVSCILVVGVLSSRVSRLGASFAVYNYHHNECDAKARSSTYIGNDEKGIRVSNRRKVIIDIDYPNVRLLILYGHHQRLRDCCTRHASQSQLHINLKLVAIIPQSSSRNSRSFSNPLIYIKAKSITSEHVGLTFVC